MRKIKNVILTNFCAIYQCFGSLKRLVTVSYILTLNMLLTYTLASILIKNNNKINQTICVEIKQGLIDVWSGLQQNIVDSACQQVEKAFVSLCSRTGVTF